MATEHINLDRIGGTQQSGANVVDVPNTAVRVSVVAGGGGGGPATIADGADVAQGATTDVAVVSDANGTLSGKLRGLVKMLADVWDSVNHRLNVAVGGSLPAGTNVIGHVIVDSPTLPTGAATDATVATVDTDLKLTQADANETRFRLQIRSQAQAADIFAATPQNGFVPTAEVPSFLGGF